MTPSIENSGPYLISGLPVWLWPGVHGVFGKKLADLDGESAETIVFEWFVFSDPRKAP